MKGNDVALKLCSNRQRELETFAISHTIIVQTFVAPEAFLSPQNDPPSQNPSSSQTRKLSKIPISKKRGAAASNYPRFHHPLLIIMQGY